MGMWNAVGGHLLDGETPERCAVREIKEELNSVVEDIEYLDFSNYEYHNIFPYDDFSITLYAYKCRLVSGDLSLTEHTDSKWTSVDEMQNMDFAEADKPLIELLNIIR